VDSSPLFLSLDDVLEYHSEQIKLYGGLDGLGSPHQLESALASPQHLFLYDPSASLFDLAAAYAFHISESQAFNDGNKRTGLQAAIGFLKGNGYAVETSNENLFEWMMEMAQKKMSREEFASKLCACSIRDRGLMAWLRTLWPS
jgi:death on curing protein